MEKSRKAKREEKEERKGKWAFASLLGLIVVLICQFNLSLAQCPPGRYFEPVFSSSRIQSNTTYENAPTLVAGCTIETLTLNFDYGLDVYEPDNDTVALRPCLVYAHGGGFAIGDKRIIPVADFCFEMAKRGYVVISLDYRKCFNTLVTNSAERAVYRAIQDMKAAIRWTKANAPVLGIDTTLIFAGGNSAGGIMALHAAFSDEDERTYLTSTYNNPDLGCSDCSGNNLPHTGRPIAVLNNWGAIYDTIFIDPRNDIPVISFHGDSDNAVFPDVGSPFNIPVFPAMYGSTLIDQRLKNLGFLSEYHIFPGAGHEPWLTNQATFDTIVAKSSDFFYRLFLKPDRVSPVPAGGAYTGSNLQIYPSDTTVGSYYCWEVSGGTIVQAHPFGLMIEVDWAATGPAWVSVTETNRYGATGLTDTLWLTVSPGVGLNSENQEAEISIFPNPAGKSIWVKGDFIKGKTSYRLFSPEGRKIITGNLAENPNGILNEISLFGIQPGIYFLQIISAENILLRKIIVH